MVERKITFEGIDSHNRPVFKSDDRNYYCSLDKLFPKDATEEEVLKEISESDLVWFGYSFDGEPQGHELPSLIIIKKNSKPEDFVIDIECYDKNNDIFFPYNWTKSDLEINCIRFKKGVYLKSEEEIIPLLEKGGYKKRPYPGFDPVPGDEKIYEQVFRAYRNHAIGFGWQKFELCGKALTTSVLAFERKWLEIRNGKQRGK